MWIERALRKANLAILRDAVLMGFMNTQYAEDVAAALRDLQQYDIEVENSTKIAFRRRTQ